VKPSAVAKPAGSGGPAAPVATGNQCFVCKKAAYDMEAMTYDKMRFHKTCFKCLSCKHTISLSAVAMIKGDLYCKNCYLRIFHEKGKYSSFGEKTLPKAEQGGAPAAGGPAPVPENKAADAAAAPAAEPAKPADAPAPAAVCADHRIARHSVGRSF
jgi:hypothetical protein